MFGKEGEARVKAMAVVLVVVVMAAVCMAADACSPFAYDRYESVWEERERESTRREATRGSFMPLFPSEERTVPRTKGRGEGQKATRASQVRKMSSPFAYEGRNRERERERENHCDMTFQKEGYKTMSFTYGLQNDVE